MAFKIEKGPYGVDVVSTDMPDMARSGNSKVKSEALPTNHIYLRLSDGQCFVTSSPLSRISQAQAEMVAHYLDKKGGLKMDIFAGNPPGVPLEVTGPDITSASQRKKKPQRKKVPSA